MPGRLFELPNEMFNLISHHIFRPAHRRKSADRRLRSALARTVCLRFTFSKSQMILNVEAGNQGRLISTEGRVDFSCGMDGRLDPLNACAELPRDGLFVARLAHIF